MLAISISSYLTLSGAKIVVWLISSSSSCIACWFLCEFFCYLFRCKPMDAEDCEQFTDVYWIKFRLFSNARLFFARWSSYIVNLSLEYDVFWESWGWGSIWHLWFSGLRKENWMSLFSLETDYRFRMLPILRVCLILRINWREDEKRF